MGENCTEYTGVVMKVTERESYHFSPGPLLPVNFDASAKREVVRCLCPLVSGWSASSTNFNYFHPFPLFWLASRLGSSLVESTLMHESGWKLRRLLRSGTSNGVSEWRTASLTQGRLELFTLPFLVIQSGYSILQSNRWLVLTDDFSLPPGALCYLYSIPCQCRDNNQLSLDKYYSLSLLIWNM